MAIHKLLITSSILAVIALFLIATSSIGLIITISYMLISDNNPALWFLIPLIVINVLFLLAQKRNVFSLTLGSLQTIFYTLLLFVQPSNPRITAIIFLGVLLVLLLSKNKLPQQPKNNPTIIDVKPRS